MAKEIGTATGFIDLIEKVQDFVINPSKAGWELGADGSYMSHLKGCMTVDQSRSGLADTLGTDNNKYGTFYDNEVVLFETTEEIEVGSISLTMPSLSGGGSMPNSPNEIRLYAGDSRTTMSVVGTWGDQATWVDLETRTFTLDIPITAQWWQFQVVSSNSSNYAYIGTLQLFNGAGVRNYINFQSNSSARALRLLAKSPFEASGISAHAGVYGIMNRSTNMYLLYVASYSNLTAETHPGSGIPYIAGTDGISSVCYVRDSEMDYWLYGDSQAVYGFVRVGSTIQQFGFGYILPYATPAQYALPMFVGAANNSWLNTYENDTDYNIRGFTNPGNGSLYVFGPDNVQHEVQNYDMYSNAERLNPNTRRLWPGCQSDYNAFRNAPGTNDTNGNYILFPLIVMHQDNSIYGELRNIYLVPSLNLSSGDTITIGGDTYRVFQNQWRTSKQDFCAVKEDW